MNAMHYNKLNQYKAVNSAGMAAQVESANPHLLISMLMKSALDRVVLGMGHMERGEVAFKGENISMAISIIESLRNSLDYKKGGEIAANLERLYEYMGRQLLTANVDNDPQKLKVVRNLLSEIKQGWDTIAPRKDKPSGDARPNSFTQSV